jgi:hypothetical protein
MSTCSLSGNTLTSTSDIILNPILSPSSGYGTGIHIKGVTGPTYYISSNNNLVIDSGGTISLSDAGSTYGSFSSNNGNIVINSGASNTGNINFGTYGYVNTTTVPNNAFIISPFNNFSLTLNSNYAGGQINLQNAGNIYGTISNDNGLHIQNKSSYIVIDSNSHPIYMYTGTNTNNTNPNNGLVLQTLQTGSAVIYGSFYNETNSSPNTPTGPNNLTIVSGNNGSNLGSIKFLGAGPQYSISVAVGNGYLSSANLSLYYDQTVNNGSAIINTPNQLALTSFSNIYLNAGSNIDGTSTSNTIYLQNGGATYGSFSSGSGGNLVISSLGNNGVILFGSYGYVYNNNSNGFTIVSQSTNLNLGVNGNINFRNNDNLYGYFNNSAGFTISSQSGDLNLNAAGGNAVTTNYSSASISSEGIINGRSFANILANSYGISGGFQLLTHYSYTTRLEINLTMGGMYLLFCSVSYNQNFVIQLIRFTTYNSINNANISGSGIGVSTSGATITCTNSNNFVTTLLYLGNSNPGI